MSTQNGHRRQNAQMVRNLRRTDNSLKALYLVQEVRFWAKFHRMDIGHISPELLKSGIIEQKRAF